MRNIILVLGIAVGSLALADANYDESKVPEYTLPDPLEGVEKAEDWPARREVIYRMFQKHVYGRVPDGVDNKVTFTENAPPESVFNGKAVMEQYKLVMGGQEVELILFRPVETKAPCPVFLAYNFKGNHSIMANPKIVLPKGWMRKTKNHKADAGQRGISASRWPVEKIIDAGYALATLYYGDVDPDFDDGFKNGVHKKFGVPKEDEWGSIGTWAWGLSRVMDVFERMKTIDAKKVAVMGHSRLGKTSLWTGASDERFALVISNNSGCGGAALSRRCFGETVQRINSHFPHWFCRNFRKYSGNEAALPVDQHMLISLIAPRPVYVASAEGDKWADPKGEFLSAKGADPVYRLLKTDGLPAEEMPAVNKPVHGRIGYHIRTGKHDVTDFDWDQYIKFADKHLK